MSEDEAKETLTDEEETAVEEEFEPTLESVLPYPLQETGNCEICNRKFDEHCFLDYFIRETHVQKIQSFLKLMHKKLDGTRHSYLKMASETTVTVLTPKEMVLNLIGTGLTHPEVANKTPLFYMHYIPSEQLKFVITVLEKRLWTVETQYEGLCQKWRSEFKQHIQLFYNKKPEDNTKSRVLESHPHYNEFVEVHEEDARSDYFQIQNAFRKISSRILAYEKFTESFASRFGEFKRSLLEKLPTPSQQIIKVRGPKKGTTS